MVVAAKANKAAKAKAKASKQPVQLKDVNVVAILDMSGSMANRAEETRGGFNSFIKQAQADQAAGGGRVTVSLTCFDFAAELRLLKVFDRTDVQSVKEIGVNEYSPSGGTPLYDAIGITLSEANFPAEEKVLVIITTDGEENQSRHWSAERVRSLIEEKEKAGWEFMFLAVGLDAFGASRAFSTPSMQTATLSTSGNRVMAGLVYEQGASQGYHAMRGGKTVSHAVASMKASHDYDGLIDRSQPGMAIDEKTAAKTKASAKSAKPAKSAKK